MPIMRFLFFLNQGNHRLLYLIVTLSLMLTITNCQTIPNEKEDEISAEEELIETRLALAKTQLDKGQPEQALVTLQPLLKKHKDNSMVLAVTGLAHLALSNPIKATQLLKKAYDLNPSGRSALNLSSALISMGSLIKARKILFKSLEYKDYNHRERIYHNIAVTFEKDNKLNEAINYYQKALYENPTYYQSLFRLGLVYKQKKENMQAIKTLEKATTFCRICLEPVKELASLYINNHQANRAVKMLGLYLKNKELTKTDRKEAQKLLVLTKRLQLKNDQKF